VPPSGGDTSFADMYRAYEELPDTMKRRLEGLKAIQSYEHFNRRYSVPANASQERDGTVQLHPVVRTHPITGRRAIYAAPGMVPAIAGLDEAES
jgi:taurine dioxygenase